MQTAFAGEKVFDILDKAGICAVALRGPFLVEKIYPEPGFKPLHDLDILINENDSEKMINAVA